MPNNDHSHQELQALARASMGGKKTAFLKAACSEELKELMVRRLQVIRAETGRTVSESEFVEKMVAIGLLGYEHVKSIEDEQQRQLAGYWSNVGQRLGGQ